MVITDVLARQFLNWLLCTQPFPIAGLVAASGPPVLYLALCTSDPTDAGSAAEPSTVATGYSRAALSAAAGAWTPASGRSTSNAVMITFGPALSDWGLITHIALYDAAFGGSLLYHGAVDVPFSMHFTRDCEWVPGALQIGFT